MFMQTCQLTKGYGRMILWMVCIILCKAMHCRRKSGSFTMPTKQDGHTLYRSMLRSHLICQQRSKVQTSNFIRSEKAKPYTQCVLHTEQSRVLQQKGTGLRHSNFIRSETAKPFTQCVL